MPRSKPWVTLLAFTVATFAATVAVVAPRTTFADGDDKYGEWTADGQKFGDVVVKGSFVRDAHASSGWLMLFTADNTGDTPATVALDVNVQRGYRAPMARVGGMPEDVMTVAQSVTVAPHQKAVASRVVPAWFTPQLETSERMAKEQDAIMAAYGKDADYVNQTRLTVLQSPVPYFSIQLALRDPKGAPPAPSAAPASPAAPAVGML